MVVTNRRSFIIGLTAALATPAIVRAESLMRVVVPTPEIIGVHQAPLYAGVMTFDPYDPSASYLHVFYVARPTEWIVIKQAHDAFADFSRHVDEVFRA